MSYAIDRPDLILMEKQLQVEIIQRAKEYKGKASNITKTIYSKLVFEEFSRKYETITVAPSFPSILDSTDYHNLNSSLLRFPDVDESNTLENNSSQIKFPEHTRVIHNYHPLSIPQPSTFRKITTGNKNLVDNCSVGFTKLLVSIGPKEKITYKNKFSEPIFGTVSLYALNKRGDGDLVKIAETFNFDATPNDIRHTFQHVYRANTLNDLSLNDSNIPLHFNPIGNISKCLFTFPTELQNTQDIFLVIELSKVLTGDPDRSLLPYIYPDKKNLFGGSSANEANSMQEVCTRLRKFRQPLGISVVKVFNDGQVFQNQNSGGCILSVFALKYCLNDAGLKQHIQDMFPPEGASPQIRLEITDLDVCLSMHNLGNDYAENIKPPQGLYSKTDDVVGDNDYLYFLPSQFHTEEEAEDISWCHETRPRFAVRSMLFHPPLNLTLTDDALRGMRSTLDNTIFVSPITFENFHRRNERNLCMEIKLIEFQDDLEIDNPLNREYIVLNNIYNPLPGYTYCLSQCTRVSYHKTNPELNDEIKIRLPLNITKKHYLLFHIYHVHVKARKVETRSSIGGFFSSKKGEDTGEIFSVIGHCFLPLLGSNSFLLSDGEYTIPVFEETTNSNTSDDGDVNPSPSASTPGAVIQQSSSYRTPSLSVSDLSLYYPTYSPYSQVYSNNNLVPNTKSNSTRRSSSTTSLKATIPTITVRTKTFSSYATTNRDLQNYFNHCPPPLGYLPSVGQFKTKDNNNNNDTEKQYAKVPSFISKDSCSDIPETNSPTNIGNSPNNISFSDTLTESNVKDSTMFLIQAGSVRRSSLRSIETSPSNTSFTESMIISANAQNDDNLKPEISRHFHSLMRQIIRILCGGVSVYHIKFMNPYCHTDLRCSTFLAMLRIFDIIAPTISGNIGEDEFIDSLFLRSYVDYTFDEEIYPTIPTRSSRTKSTEENNNEGSLTSTTKTTEPDDDNSSHDTTSKTTTSTITTTTATTTGEHKTLTKKPRSMDLVRRQLTSLLSEEELFEKTLDHILDQVTKITEQGVILSSINKIVNEIINEKLTLSTPLPSPSLTPPLPPSDSSSNSISRPTSTSTNSTIGFGINSDTILNETIQSRWWKGHLNSQSILELILSNDPLDLFNESILKNHIQQLNSLKDPVILDPILTPYHTLDGFFLRKLRLKEHLVEGDSKHPSFQWWPWMYEIITYQWRCLLNIYDESTQSTISNTTNSNALLSTGLSSTSPSSSPINSSTTNSITKTYPTSSRIDEEEEEEEEEEGETIADTIENDDDSNTDQIDSRLSRGQNSTQSDEFDNRLSDRYGKEPYPYNANDPVLKDNIRNSENIRSLLIKYGPILLNMIYKSLALRINREYKTAPVIIDEEYIVEAELLFTALGKEVHLKGNNLLLSRRLNMAIGIFFRDLFGLLVPIQVARLIYSFLLASRKIQKENQKLQKKVQIEQIKTRINFLHELSKADYFFHLNFTLYFGENPSKYQYIPIYSTKDILDHATGSDVRGIKNPPHHWFVHLIIHEVMSDYIYIADNYKEGTLKMLRELICRLNYDKRFQTPEYQNRTASMFLPLLHYFIELSNHLYELSPDSKERRDSLALVVYVLQECPEYIIREEIRNMTHHHGSRNIITTLFPKTNTKAENKLHTQPLKLPIMNLITLLHLILDTFELSLSDGGEKGDVSVALSPDIIVDAVESQDIGNKTTNSSLSYVKSQIKTTDDKLGKLEAMNNRRANKVQTSGSITSQTSRPTRTEKKVGEERGWSKSLKNQTAPTMAKGSNSVVSVLRSLTAAKFLNYETTLTVLNTLNFMISDCPKLLQTSNILNSIYSDTNFNDQFKEFLTSIMSVLLHILYSTQSEICIFKTFQLASKIILQYGLPTILKLIGDTFQHWIRKILFSFGSFYSSIRESSLQLYEICLQSCYQWEGSLQSVILPTFGVINDTLLALKNKYRSLDNNPSNRNKITYSTALLKSIDSLRDDTIITYLKNVNDSFYDAYNSSKLNFLNNFLTIINILLFINNKLGIIIPYDWNGGLGYNNLYETFLNSSINTGNNQVKFKLISEDMKQKILIELKNIDLETILEQFVQAADAYGTYNLPRFKIYILENLCILHEIYNQVAEMAMIRWNIFTICEQMDKLSIELWSPKPPLKIVRRGSDSKVADKQPHFMAALITSLQLPSAHPWISLESLRKHAILSLQISIDLFRETHLVYLAERSLNSLIGIYRNDHGDNLKQLGQCYDKLSKLFEEASTGNMNFAMGTFFRVLFIGQGIPNSLRGREYIVRNGSYLHVSEFQSLIKTQLQSLVGPNIPVFVLPDTSPMPSNDAQEAYAYMTSLTPVILNPSDLSKDISSSTTSLWKKRVGNIAYRNEYSVFQFSVPYTKEGKAHAKTMDLQWKRTTTLYVKYPFPYILTRQIVIKREVRDLSPIEVALDDIQERILSMTDELRKPPSKVQSDINNLMRLVQGTVAPQVNAGAAEVAKVFLTKVKVPNRLELGDNDLLQLKHRTILKESLVQFLEKSRLLIEKYRSITGVSASDLPIDTRTRTLTSNHSYPTTAHYLGSNSSISLFPSSTCQSLLNFPHLCYNKSTHHNFFIRKYYTRENEAVASSLAENSTDSNKLPNSTGPVTVINPSGLPSQTAPTLTSSLSTSSSELVWLTEMEKGYDILVDAIYPYICDIASLAER